MKLKFAVRAGTMMLACGIAQANAASWYVGYGAQFAETSSVFEDDDKEDWEAGDSMGNSLFGGVAFNRHWAMELGYIDWGLEQKGRLAEEDAEAGLPRDTINFERSISLGFRTSYPLLAGVSAELGMGLHRWTVEGTIIDYTEWTTDEETGEDVLLDYDVEKGSGSDTDLYYFAGGKYQITPNLEAGLEFSKYDFGLTNIESWRLSMAYYFDAKNGGVDMFRPKDVYARVLLSYNRASIDDTWKDFYIADEDYIDDPYYEDDYYYDVDGYDGSVDEDTNSMGFSALVGFQLSEHWSAEVGYVNLGDAALSATIEDEDGRKTTAEFYKRSVDGFTYGIAANFSPYTRVSPYWRIGIFDWDQDVEKLPDSDAKKYSQTIDGIGMYMGFGLGFAVTPQLSIITEITRYGYGIKADEGDGIRDYSNTLSAGVQYRFGVMDRPQPKPRPNNGFRTYPAASPGAASSGSTSSGSVTSGGTFNTEYYEEDEETDNNAGKSTSVACDPKHKHLFFDCD